MYRALSNMEVLNPSKMSAPMRKLGILKVSFLKGLDLSWSRLSVALQMKRFVQDDALNTDWIVNLGNETTDLDREIPKSKDDLYRRLLMKPDQPPNAKILRLAIIGLPNAGKSTLMNRMMKWRISAVSKKVHTTRKNTTAVLTRNETQIVFLDTPGIRDFRVRKKYFLEKSLIMDPNRSLETADLVAVIVDTSNKWTRNQLSKDVLKILHLHPHVPSILILNKVDDLKTKEVLLHLTRMLTDQKVDGEEVKFTTKKLKPHAVKKDYTELFDRYEKFLKDKKKKSNDVDCSDKSPICHSDIDSTRHDQEPCENASEEIDFETVRHEEDAIEDSDIDFNEHSSEESESDKSLNEAHTPVHNPSFLDELKVKIEKEKYLIDHDYPSYIQKLKDLNRIVADKQGWPNFSRVFMISAFNGDGVDELEDYIFSQAKPGDWDFHSSFVTEQSPFEIAKMCVWEKMLEHLPKEIPYMLFPEIILWDMDKEDDCLYVVMDIETYTQRECSTLIGPNGETIRKISTEAQQELLNSFRCEIKLKLQVKLKPNKKKRR